MRWRALDFPRGFFFAEDVDELPAEAASFRSLSSMTARERDAALAAGAIAYLFNDWVAERFNLPSPDVPELRGDATPEAAAQVVRSNWGLGEQPISSMVKLLESKGVRVFSLCEDTKNVDAFSCWRGERPFIFLNTFKSTERSRFDAAHDLGHLVMHKHGAPQDSRGHAARRSQRTLIIGEVCLHRLTPPTRLCGEARSNGSLDTNRDQCWSGS